MDEKLKARDKAVSDCINLLSHYWANNKAETEAARWLTQHLVKLRDALPKLKPLK